MSHTWITTFEKLTWNGSVWQTVVLGKYKTPADYIRELSSVCHVHPSAAQLMQQLVISPVEREVRLALTEAIGIIKQIERSADIGDLARRATLMRAALKLGLELCPAEVGPALRLTYREPITEGHWYWGVPTQSLSIGMQPMTRRVSLFKKQPAVFGLTMDSAKGRWLDADNLSIAGKLVFVIP
jgi:hypothetical protein